jgi:hypothetical protein
MFNEIDENINTFIKTSQPWYRETKLIAITSYRNICELATISGSKYIIHI